MGIISEAGSFIKNSADRLRALLTITQVLTCSTEDANNSSRSSNIGAAGDGPIGEGSGRPGGGLCDSNIQPPIEDHVIVPVDSLAASGFSFGTTARRTTSPGHVSTSIDDMPTCSDLPRNVAIPDRWATLRVSCSGFYSTMIGLLFVAADVKIQQAIKLP